MDYYTALLESYSLLRKRKFKLTLKEEGEGPQAGKSDAEVLQIIIGAGAGKTRDNAGVEGAASFWSNQGDPPEIIGAWGSSNFGITVTAGGSSTLRPPGNKKADDIINYIRTGDGAQEDGVAPVATNPNEGLTPKAQELDKLIRGDDSTPGMMEDSDSIERFFPGLKETEINSRSTKQINIALKKARGEAQGIGIRGKAATIKSITDRLLASPDLPFEDADKALTHGVSIVRAVGELHSGKQFSATELKDLITGLELTKGGVLFDGVYLDFRSDATHENDFFTNAVLQVNDLVQQHNDTCSNLEKGSDARKECYVPEVITPFSESKDLLSRSERGALLEEVPAIHETWMAIANLKALGKPTKEVEKHLRNQISSALRRGTADQVKATLSEGLNLEAKEILALAEGEDSVDITNNLVNFFVGEEGMSKEAAYEMVAQATTADDKGRRALLLLIYSSRGFHKSVAELDFLETKVIGTEDSTSKGQKGDLQRVVTTASFKKWKAKLQASESTTSKMLDKYSKLTGDSRVGWDNLGSSDGDTTTFNTEVKSVDSTDKSRVKAGEGSNSRSADVLEGKVNNKREAEYVDALVERIDNCYSNTGNNEFSGKSIRTVASSFEKGVKEARTHIEGPLMGQPVLMPNGKKLEGAASTIVDAWSKNLKTLTPKYKERARIAKEGLASKTPTRKQSEAIKKINRDLHEAEILKRINKSSNKDGTLEGDGLGYVLYRLGLEGGSLEENFKDVRGYGNSKQATGLVNSSLFGTIGMVASKKATVFHRGKTTVIRTNEGEALMRVSWEGGKAVASFAKGALSPLESASKEKASQGEATVQAFLQGQMELLERLLGQTYSSQ